MKFKKKSHLPNVKKMQLNSIAEKIQFFTVFATAVSAIAIYVGWVFSKTYFSQIGAPWVADSMSVPSMIKLAGPIIVQILLLSLFCQLIALNVDDVLLSLYKFDVGYSCIALVFLLTVGVDRFTNHKYFESSIIFYCWSAISFFMSLATASGLVKLIFIVRSRSKEISGKNHMSLNMILVTGMLINPNMLAFGTANYDINEIESRLPTAKSESLSKDRIWYFLVMLDNNYVFISPSDKKNNKLFHIVNIRESIALDAMKSMD